MNLMGVEGRKTSPAPPRKPTPDFCVAVGDLREEAAEQAENGSHQQQLMRDEARQLYQKAMDLDPRCKKAYVALGRLYVKADDYDRALEVYDKGLKKLPKEASLWSERGICLRCKKDWAGALVTMQKAHTLEPENREYGTQYGLALARAGRIDESFAVLSKVQGKAEAHYKIARMLEHLRQPEQSKHHLQLALQLKPDLAPAREMLAHLEGGPPEANRSPIADVSFEQVQP